MSVEVLTYGNMTWINIMRATPEDMRYLRAHYPFHPLELEDCLSNIERPKVDAHDYNFKKKHIERIVKDGDKVKATIFFRGREMAHPDFGRRILDRLMEDLDGIAVAEAHPSMQGNQMHIILSGVTGTKKGQEV